MNEILASLILAIVQGITEWLPVSSSGHLFLVSRLLGIESSTQLIVALHFGTLMAIFVYFGKDIVEIMRDLFSFRFSTSNGRLGLALIIATLPVALAGYLMHSFVGETGNNLWLLSAGFLITSLLLFVGSESRVAKNSKSDFTLKNALFIGLAQCISLSRGISRSGTTIVTGLLLGLNEKEAVKFSFLLSIPVVFGANILLNGNQSLPPHYFISSLIAFFVGLGTIHLSFTYVLNNRKNLKWIGFYMLLLAIGTYIFLI